MDAAFFHDHKFRCDASGLHLSPGGLPYAVLTRYLKHFDTLKVVARVQPLAPGDDEARLTVTSGPRVQMQCVPPSSRLALLAGSSVRQHVRRVLASADVAIIRLPSLIGIVAAREALRLRKPWVAEVVACAWDGLWNHGSIQGRPAAVPLYVLNRHYIARAPFALYVTREFLQRRYPCHGFTEGCSDVVVERIDHEALTQRLERIRSGFRTGPVLLGLVGALTVDYKGHETALRAVADLRSRGIDVRLRCLGGGDSSRWRRRSAELGVADAVEFCGTVPSGRPVLEWMDTLDLFLIPSLQEGLPRALVEAMSRALPALGARTGGIPELIGPEFVHAPRDHRHLAKLVANFIGSPLMLEEAARANFDRSTEFVSLKLEQRRDEFLTRFRSFATDVARG